LKLLGDIHAHRGGLDIDQALAYYQQALTLAKALGARPLRPIATVALACCIIRPARPSKPAPNCPGPSRCIARWR
jgi:hypothetical protein